MRLFQHKNYNVLASELCHPVTYIYGKIYVCETCRKHLSKIAIPCQAVCNKMETDRISNELKDLKCLQKTLISKSILF